jgi:arsenical pump membrane protein
MLTVHIIIALLAVGALALGPRSSAAAVAAAVASLVDIGLGSAVGPALGVVTPLLAFLTAALTLAALIESSGLAARAAGLVASAARGNTFVLYLVACLLTAFLTAVVSLDGAVVLAVPLLRRVSRITGTSFAPLFLGAVAVSNAGSAAVPQGNPTNLVLIDRLGIGPGAFLEHMLLPGLAAGVVCVTAVALHQRRALAGRYPVSTSCWTPLSRRERRAAVAVGAAALAGWLAPLAGIAPWWPFSGTVAVAILIERTRPPLVVPWRIGVQVAALVVAVEALGLPVPTPRATTLPDLLAIALAVGAASALVNNLPASAAVAALLGAGPAAYAASIGLSAGALATPQGSVATLIAGDLAGIDAPPLGVLHLAVLAAAAVIAATLLLWVTA